MEGATAVGLQELATRATGGDARAMELLLVDVRRMVLRYCRARLARVPGADHAADDAAQEVCLAVVNALPRYRDEGRPFESFVYGIAAHKVADVHRAAARAPLATAEPPDAPDEAAGPEEVALRRSEADRARALLEHLPDAQRELLLLRVVVGLSAEETGRALGMTPGAVRVAQHRALAKLRTVAQREDAAALEAEERAGAPVAAAAPALPVPAATTTAPLRRRRGRGSR
ncbi:sigma-70 family RNA polymerase sigma factor [Vallicoccus soli]|uniref:Sigma-70 family RNA polymerase sigma factor n=1 Tax=Vallicoccus soli TaxID=2339232 RepID=A0A3A3YQX2_9ACTN|nr:RNA polymerase sigma factor ShbA [Vallicoccus soli]RJK92622.1 sigma-70 family RNA polymerase sigma factor [Vallicoccus soli]